jgi:hypothetical protein
LGALALCCGAGTAAPFERAVLLGGLLGAAGVVDPAPLLGFGAGTTATGGPGAAGG